MSARARVVVPDGRWAGEAARRIADAMQRAAARSERVALVVAGGSTPRAAYERLGAGPEGTELDWSRVDVFFGDERCVPPAAPESNHRLLAESLLAGLAARGAPGPRVHRMRGEDPDPEGAARAYERILPERPDVLLLGMGTDGHTASLFPGSALVGERERRVAVAVGGSPRVARLSITPAVLAAAGETLVLVRGADKAARVASVLEAPGEAEREPIRLVTGGTWILDEAAAAGLSRPAGGHAGAETAGAEGGRR